MSHEAGAINHDQSEPNIKNIVKGVLISAFLFIAFLYLGALIYKGGISEELNKKENVGAPESLQSLRSMEDESLNGYKWMDKEKGTVEIPISDAIEKTAQTYRAAQ